MIELKDEKPKDEKTEDKLKGEEKKPNPYTEEDSGYHDSLFGRTSRGDGRSMPPRDYDD